MHVTLGSKQIIIYQLNEVFDFDETCYNYQGGIKYFVKFRLNPAEILTFAFPLKFTPLFLKKIMKIRSQNCFSITARGSDGYEKFH